MTVHEKFRRRRRWILFGFPVFFLLFAASGELYKKYNSSVFLALGIVAFGGFILCIILLNIGFRCPGCRKLIMPTNNPADASVLSFPNFCGHCGLDLRSVEKEAATI
jgi:hypothetical protein